MNAPFIPFNEPFFNPILSPINLNLLSNKNHLSTSFNHKKHKCKVHKKLGKNINKMKRIV